MIELLEMYDGESHATFSQKDIYMVRVQNLYRWMTCGVFDINVHEVLGYSGGITLTFSFLVVHIIFGFFLVVLAYIFSTLGLDDDFPFDFVMQI